MVNSAGVRHTTSLCVIIDRKKRQWTVDCGLVIHTLSNEQTKHHLSFCCCHHDENRNINTRLAIERMWILLYFVLFVFFIFSLIRVSCNFLPHSASMYGIPCSKHVLNHNSRHKNVDNSWFYKKHTSVSFKRRAVETPMLLIWRSSNSYFHHNKYT